MTGTDEGEATLKERLNAIVEAAKKQNPREIGLEEALAVIEGKKPEWGEYGHEPVTIGSSLAYTHRYTATVQLEGQHDPVVRFIVMNTEDSFKSCGGSVGFHTDYILVVADEKSGTPILWHGEEHKGSTGPVEKLFQYIGRIADLKKVAGKDDADGAAAALKLYVDPGYHAPKPRFINQ